ncbi:MAG: DUF1800 family protein [Pseudomonadota bacterium]
MRRNVIHRGARMLATMALLLGLEATAGTDNGLVFADGFEPQALDETEAARFLTQATFGPTRADIDAVVADGLEAWIDDQLALPATLTRPALEEITVNENLAGRSVTNGYRVQRWIDVAVRGPDQLRQKMAYALSQIIVVSDRDPGLNDQPIMMAEWGDLLVRNALGNYRTLLGEVARSPMMGIYLSHLRNRRFELFPRCADKLAPIDDNGGAHYDCDSADATNNGLEEPTIVRYDLPAGGLVAPDENFAREVMQLFSIGLVERELDFTPIELGGEPVPTYDQMMIGTMARVLTGLGFACSGDRVVEGQAINRICGCTGIDCNFSIGAFASQPPELTLNGQTGLVHPDRYEPLQCYPLFHDTGRDRGGFQYPGTAGIEPVGATIDLLDGETIPAVTPDAEKSLVLGGAELARIDEIAAGEAASFANRCRFSFGNTAEKQACLDYCDTSLETALDMLFEHPNTAAMVARQLIQRLVSSNPSPEYIQRVAEVFVDNGAGVRGDLAAVARAILLDDEARPALAKGFAAGDGKPREPFLKLIQLWRSLEAVPGDGDRSDEFARWGAFVNCRPQQWPSCNYLQRPLGAPTVFNFYEPDYQQPGEIADAGLFSPELQIVNESSAILAANDLYGQICSGYGGFTGDCHGPFRGGSDTAYFPPEVLDGLPGGSCGASCSATDDLALIDELDLLLTAGAMTGAVTAPEDPGSSANTGTRGTLFELLQTELAGDLGEGNPQDGRRRAILYLLHLIAISPDYATQR